MKYLVVALFLTVGLMIACQQTSSAPATKPDSNPAGNVLTLPTNIPSSVIQSAILGKWRHGLPETCPPSMDPRMFAEIKKQNLPENKTYYLQFYDTSECILTNESVIISGQYRFIGNEYIEFYWNSPSQGLIWAMGKNIFKVEISIGKMIITSGKEEKSTFVKVQ